MLSALSPEQVVDIPPLSQQQTELVSALGGNLCSLERLARDAGCDAGALMAALIELELLGLLEQQPGGYRLTPLGERQLAFQL